MKRSILLLISFCFALLLNSQVVAQSVRPQAVIAKAGVVKPVIDGVLDDVWASVEQHNVNLPFRTEAPTLGAEGSTYWKALWDDSGMYILIVANDDVWYPWFAQTAIIGSNYLFDKIELYFDTNYNLADGIGGQDGTTGNRSIVPDPIDGKLDGSLLTMAIQGGTVQYAYNVANPAWNTEWFIPWEAIPDKDGILFDKTGTMGFDVDISDNDNDGFGRKRAMWSNDGTRGIQDEDWNNMDEAGHITFEGAVATIYVDKITLSGGTSITTDNGTLQLTATILPADASNQKLKWTVENGTGSAEISSGGLLTAHKDGLVTVKAAALDGGWTESDPVTITISGQVLQLADINLIKNGNFDNNTGSLPDLWSFWSSNGGLTPIATDGVAVCDPETGVNVWDYQFWQLGIQALPNISYTFSFKAWADANRTIIVSYDDPNNNYRSLGTSSDAEATGGQSVWTVNLTTEPTVYTFHVVCNQIVANTIQRLVFQLAATTDVVYLDDVTLASSEDLTGLTLSANVATLDATEGSTATVDITTAGSWTAGSDQSWLTVSPTSGTGNQTLNFIAEANPSIAPRFALVTVSAPGFLGSQTVKITQEGPNAPLNLSAGGLKTTFTAQELAAITKLTLTGTIDARDFKTMRDNMPLLAELDLSTATIAEYSGTEGTLSGDYYYSVNSIPSAAFYYSATGLGKTSLRTILLPTNTTSIDIRAFRGCTGLVSLFIPSLVSTIAWNSLSKAAGSVTVDDNNPNFSSLDGVLFNKQQTTLIHYPSSKSGSYTIPSTVSLIDAFAFDLCHVLTSVSIPTSVTSINQWAFYECLSLSTLTIPSSVTYIGNNAFQNCNGLTSLTVDWSTPLNLSSSPDIFYQVNKPTCTLNVPYGTASLYRAANQWQDFTNIVEATDGFNLSSNAANIEATEGSTATVDIRANVAWTASSDQTWLSVSPTSGTGNQTLTFTGEANASVAPRFAVVTVSASGFLGSQTINITQQGSNAPLNLSAGGLKTTFTAQELAAITKLTLTGTIDARDFKTMRDNMPLLAELDISAATIVAYNGPDGTSIWGNNNYADNDIPEFAFMNSNWVGKTSLTSVVFPSNLTSISRFAFNYCYGLTSISIPSLVTTIGDQAFGWCYNLTSVSFPSSVTTIGSYSFRGCQGITTIFIPSPVISIGSSAFPNTGLINVDAGNQNYSSIDDVLFNKAQTTILQCPISKTGTYSIPSTVVTIGQSAFESCNQLTSVNIPASVQLIDGNAFSFCSGLTNLNIPSSVTTIKSGAFGYCNSLTSITVSWSVPLDLSSYNSIFYNVNKTTCILNVPYGTASRYAAANQWQDFTNIVEATDGFNLSAATANIGAAAGSTASVDITANVDWTASSDQSWLSVSPTSGSNNGAITLTATENPGAARIARVTVSSTGFSDQFITVTQAGIPALILASTMDGNAPMVDQPSTLINSNNVWEYFRFIPTESGTYTFTSTSDSDPYGRIFDSLGNNLTGDDDSGYDMNFVFSYNLIAGQLYYFGLFNYWGNNREITVNITGGGLQSFSLSLTTAYLGSAEGSNTTVDVKCKVDWTASSNQTWLTINPTSGTNNGTITLTATENTGAARNATVTVSSAGSTDQILIVTQASGLEVSSNTANLAAAEGSATTVEVLANVEWTASSNQTWLTVSPISGIGSQTLTFTAEANPSNTTFRSATITVSAPGIPSKTIAVSQTFTIDPTLLDAFEPDNSMETASTIIPDVAQQHSIYPIGDVDYASFELTNAPAQIVVNFTTASGGRQIQLLDAYGNVWANTSGQISVPLTENGTYYIRAWNTEPDQITLNYELLLNITPIVSDQYEPDNTPESASVIVPNVIQQHSIYPVGDVDYASFELTNAPAQIEIHFNASSGYDQIQLLAADGNTVIYQSNQVLTSLTQNGKYYIRAWNPDNQLVDSYQLSLKITPIIIDKYEPDNTWEQATTILPFFEQDDHTIKADGDVDFVKFTVSDAPRTVYVDVFDTRRNCNNFGVWLYGTDGTTQLNYSSWGGNYCGAARIEQNITTNGTYFVKVAVPQGWSGMREDYTIKVTTDGAAPIIVCNAGDRAALVAIYNALNGPNWNRQQGWLTDNVMDWQGVTLNAEGRVTKLNLIRNNLQGTIPSEIGNLTALRYLNLGNQRYVEYGGQYNNLNGSTLPSSLANLVNLEVLSLDQLQFNTELPDVFSGIVNLRELYLNENYFTNVQLPTGILSCSKLERLDIGYNNFSQLPNLTSLTNIHEFDAYQNRLTFEDIEPNVSISGINYSPQNKIGQPLGLNPEPGSTVSQTIEVGGEYNQYQWYKNDLPLEGQTSNTLQIENVSLSDAGIYQLQVTNTVATQLTLYSEPITIYQKELPIYKALEAFYNSTGGPNWNNNTNWLSDAPLSMWFGIYQDNGWNTFQLSSNNLVGQLPASMGDLTIFNSIYISNNPQLTGSIPESIGNLSNLNDLGLYSNALTGEIPATIGNLKNLGYFHVANNQLSGSIPSAITGCTNLNGLYLYNNQIENLPDLSAMPNYLNLNIYNNRLQFDDIEPTLTGNPNLYFNYNPQAKFGQAVSLNPEPGTLFTQTFEVGGEHNLYQWYKDNQLLEGKTSNTLTIQSMSIADAGIYELRVTNTVATQLTLTSEPITLYQKETLFYKALEAFYNSTGGPNWNNKTNWLSDEPLSTWFGIYQDNGWSLQLYNNNLVGQLPANMGDLTLFNAIYIANNPQLSGSIPESIGNLSNLIDLGLYSNALTGEIPATIGNLKNLGYFHVANNQLSGSVPSAITGCTNLYLLYLDNNQIENLPDLSAMPNYLNLNIYNNRLQFDDIEPTLTGKSNLNFNFNPQAKFGQVEIYTTQPGEAFTLTATCGGIGNLYQWVKDGNLMDGKTANTLVFDALLATDRGTYTCQVTNPDVPKLTLESENMSIIDPSLLDAFEPDNTIEQASTIASGDVQQHNIYPIGDVDYASFEITSPSQVEINFATASGASQLQLLASDGSTVLVQSWSQISTILNQNGKYYIRAWNPDNQLVDSYQLSLNISPYIFISSISLTGGTITTDNGTLQMVASILPADATNQNLIWSVENTTGRASIDANGLLTAVMNGAVNVKAKATDGSGVEGTAVVSISGQIITLDDLNLIKNGNFSNGLTFWGGWIDSGVAGQIAPVVTDGVCVMVPGLASDGNNWHYQHSQNGLQADANVPYILKFKSWGSGNAQAVVDFEDTSGNSYNRYGASSDPEAFNGRSEWHYNISVTPTWYTFHVTFDQILANTDQKIQWMLSLSNETNYLDSISLVRESDLLLVNSPIANAGSNQQWAVSKIIYVDDKEKIALGASTDQIMQVLERGINMSLLAYIPLFSYAQAISTTVTLDGSASSDPEGDPLTYKWTAPAGIILSSTTAVKPTFTTPEVTETTTYTFTLVVNDGKKDSPPSTVTVTSRYLGAYNHYFVPAWTGNGVDHMNISIYSAKLDGVELEAGDEVGIFDGTTCVGAGILTGTISLINSLDIAVSRNDGSGNGYTSGNAITFKLYDKSKNLEMPNVTAVYSNTDPSWSTDGKFAAGVTAFAELSGLTKVNQDIALNTGWNIISANVVPANLNLKDLFQSLIDAGALKKVMDEAGKTIENFGAFGGWKNNIGNLNSTKGYKVNVTVASTLSLEGTPVQLPLDIPLATGWNIISYPSASLQDAKALVQSLIDAGKLKKVMDEAGKTIENFGAFGGWKNNIGNFMPGKGYKVNVTSNCTLTIPSSGTKAAIVVPEVLASTHFKPVFFGNGTDHMSINLVNLLSSGLLAGDEIGIFDGKYCVGSATIVAEQLMDGSISIATSANDELEETLNGFTCGHPVNLQLYRGGQTYNLKFSKVSGNELFEKNGSLFAKISMNELTTIQINSDLAGFKCFPNPFTQELTIEVQNPDQTEITVEIYNLAGQRIKNLFKGTCNGNLILKWKGTNESGQQVAPGVYLCKLNGQSKQVIFEGGKGK